MIGISILGGDAGETLDLLRRADVAGVPAAWLTQAGGAADPLTIFAAACVLTERIKLGTAIIPTWSRPPVMLAQQVLALNAFAPGRLRIGVGPSTPAAMEPLYGVQWRQPMRQLREYLTVLRSLLHEGYVHFEGRHLRARARIPAAIDVPVMGSALSPGAFRVCGEAAEGAISWMCPWSYLRDVALPALREGAEKASRETPPLIVHVPVCLSDDVDEVREAVRGQLGRYAQFPVYQAMFAAAGFPNVTRELPDALIDSLVASGGEAAIAERLRTILTEGAGEVMAHPVLAGEDREAYMRRFFALVANAARPAGAAP